MAYKNLENFTEKYNKAINSGIKEIRISTIEAGLLLQDITLISTSVTNMNLSNQNLKDSVDLLVTILKKMVEEEGNDSF